LRGERSKKLITVFIILNFLRGAVGGSGSGGDGGGGAGGAI
jgi:hypothetical protein